jgi:hypothetical protein
VQWVCAQTSNAGAIRKAAARWLLLFFALAEFVVKSILRNTLRITARISLTADLCIDGEHWI